MLALDPNTLETAPTPLADGDSAPGPVRCGGPSWPQLALMAALLVACFGQYITWMAERWWRDEYYGHGMFIPVVSGYLISRRLGTMGALPRRGFAWGLPFIVIGLGLHILASTADVNFPSGFGLVLTIFGMTAWLWGWPVARACAFPLAFLAFMVPLGRLLVDKAGMPMQLMAASLGGTFAAHLGLPVQIEGTTLRVPGYTFAVAAACSGLKSVIAMTALAALYAYLVEGRLWQRLLIVAGCIPVAILSNAIRVTVTLILGKALGRGAAEGFLHTASGAMVFIIALIGLTLLASVLRCNQIREDV